MLSICRIPKIGPRQRRHSLPLKSAFLLLALTSEATYINSTRREKSRPNLHFLRHASAPLQFRYACFGSDGVPGQTSTGSCPLSDPGGSQSARFCYSFPSLTIWQTRIHRSPCRCLQETTSSGLPSALGSRFSRPPCIGPWALLGLAQRMLLFRRLLF